MALDLNTAPYYDDFNEAKNYLRVLYNPGRAVQARELTQAQTILHNQLSKNSSQIFKDGTPIIGGGIKVNSSKVSIVLNPFKADGVTPINVPALNGVTLHKVDGTDVDTGDKAVVTHYDTATRTLLVDYIGGGFLATDKLVVRDSGNVIINDVVVTTVGVATTATIDDGIFYISGSFVILQKQNIVVDWLSGSGHYIIGLQMTDSIATSGTDSTLVDPANGSYNFSAPGADRLKITLTLTSYLSTATEPNDFYKLVEFDNGTTLFAVKTVQYSEILDLLAKRTYDESGDYVVEPFEITIDDDPLDDTKYRVKLDSGLAYIKGYEVSTSSPKYLSNLKPRTSLLSNNESVYIDYGLFVDVDEASLSGMFNIASRETVTLYSGLSGTGRSLTTTRVISISRSPTNGLRLWLEWKPSITDFLISTKSIVSTSTAIVNILPFDKANQSVNNSLVYPLNKHNVKDVVLNNTIVTVSKSYYNVTKNAGTFTLLSDDNTSNFIGSGQSGVVLVLDATGAPSIEFTYVANQVAGGKSTLVITPTGGLVSSATISVVAKLQRPTANPKTKLLTSNIYVFDSTSTSQSFTHYDLFRINKVEVKTIGALDSTYQVVSPSTYKEHTNNTDVSYGFGSISGLTNNMSYRITYDYFAHSGTGDFFSINSYTTSANLAIVPNIYSLIGTYKPTYGGQELDLCDVLDFRRSPTDYTSGVYTPAPQETLFLDYDYYLARHDKVVVDKEGNFSIINGVPAELPESPESDSKGVVTLYDLYVPAYVKTPRSILVEEHKLDNYTMSDIYALESRIEKLEYYTSLTLLEKQSSELNFVDENGLNKFKNGIMVDNFTNFDNSDVQDVVYRSTIDDENGILRCPFVDDSIEYTMGTLPANLTVKDNQVMFNYSSVTWISQPKASGVTNLMPFDVVSYEGHLKITPSSDTWVDNVNLPIIRTTVDNRDNGLTKQFNTIPRWNQWQTRVIGRRVLSLRYAGIQRAYQAGRGGWYPIRAVYDATVQTTNLLTRTGVAKTSNDITRNITSDRVISRTNIPFMRSRSISYTAKALRPLTNHSAFFDSENVDVYCTTLKSDSLGNLTGTFSLPSGKFATGSKVFKLVDSDHGSEVLSEAGSTYTAKGTLVKHQRTITSIRQTVYSIRQVSQTSSSITTSSQRSFGGWYDPVAQSFRVDGTTGGIFLSDVDLFFKTKDASVPVKIHVVTMENGTPTNNIIPGSVVVVDAANVAISTDASLPTQFTFDAPIYLSNNTDYAFVAMSNCKEYFMFHSELGKTDIASGKRIVEQPYLGSMYTSQNATVWTAEQTKDVKFVLYKAQFQTGTGIVPVTNDNTLLTADTWASTITPNFEVLEHDGSSTAVEYMFSDESVYTETTNKENKDLSTRKSLTTNGVSNVKWNIILTNSNPNVTPILDRERLSSVIVYNDVLPIVNPTPEEITGGYKDSGVYKTKSVQLADPANDLRVMFDAKLAGNSKVDVFYKASSYIPKYVDVDPASSLHNKFKNNTCYVYWYNSTTGSWSERSTVFVTKNDSVSSPNRVYISKVGDYTDFIASVDFAVNSITNIFISDHNIDNTIITIGTWSGATSYTIGSYVFYNGVLYISEISTNLNNIPTATGTAWTVIETTGVTSIVNDDPESSWKAMKLQTAVDPAVNTSTQYIEYTYIPDEYAEGDFTEFSVKLEMESIDYVNIPLIKNFRSIALM